MSITSPIWSPDMNEASAALTSGLYALTPFSPQSHRLEPNGPLVPAGTANRCIMLKRGYLELLTPTAETPVADQLPARCGVTSAYASSRSVRAVAQADPNGS